MNPGRTGDELQVNDTSTVSVRSGGARHGPGGLAFTVSPGLVLRAGLTSAIVLSAASLAGQVLRHGVGIDGGLVPFYTDLTDVDFERSLPTWFQTVLLAACGAALWTVADMVRAGAGRHHRHWRALAAVFVLLSLDESLALHERATEPVRDALDLGGAFYLSWIIVAVPLVALVALLAIPFLRSLPRWTLGAFLVCGGVYLAGTVGMEMVGGVLFERSGVDTVAYSVAAGAEELLEMFGAVLFLAAVSEHRRRLAAAAAEPQAQ